MFFAGDSMQDYLSLDGQIQHKLAYIHDFIPSSKRLILIGHSIGCYMILKMLSAETDNSLSNCRDVAKCYLLFPTVEHMALSPNGQFYTPLLKYFRWLVPLLTLPLKFLPYRLIQFLVEWYFGGGQIPKCMVEATMKLLSSSSCENCLYMASTEMQSVCKLDMDTVAKNIDRFCFYYGTKDAWCPTEYYHKMKKLFPAAEIYLCSHGIEHAFVLHHSEEMASVVSDWLLLN